MSYLPIENYGVIGNMRTAALVGLNGSIDWLCLPHFDSPSIFAGILDYHKGGYFRIAPSGEDIREKQLYWPDTNVLVTRFYYGGGVAELVDFMPVGKGVKSQVIRCLKVTRGKMAFRMVCRPAFDYARASHTIRLLKGGALFESGDLRVSLMSHYSLSEEDGALVVDFELKAGDETAFVLRLLEGKDDVEEPCPDDKCAERQFRQTVEYWRTWLSQCTYKGRWREAVHRSALAMKLLTFEPTGAIVAAPHLQPARDCWR